jgi:hemoglobin/transferrin/lactoferrin receptor protein
MLKIEAGAYFTILDNAMTVQATKFNALDSILVDGDMLKAMSIQNVNSATIWGFYADATLRPIKYLSLNATINSTFGKYKDENASIVPMDHIPPMFAKVSAAYTLSNMKFEAFVRFSAAKKLEDYSPSGEDNLTQTAITGIDSGGNFSYAGTPSWYTLNFRAAYDVMKNLSVNAGIENILDRHYRQFASGISSPGRNIYGTVRLKF